MTIKEIAKAFDMTVKEFSEYIGYSRQSLYSRALNQSRAKSIARLLCLRNKEQFEAEIQRAKERFNERETAVKEFERIFCGEALKDGKDRGI